MTVDWHIRQIDSKPTEQYRSSKGQMLTTTRMSGYSLDPESSDESDSDLSGASFFDICANASKMNLGPRDSWAPPSHPWNKHYAPSLKKAAHNSRTNKDSHLLLKSRNKLGNSLFASRGRNPSTAHLSLLRYPHDLKNRKSPKDPSPGNGNMCASPADERRKKCVHFEVSRCSQMHSGSNNSNPDCMGVESQDRTANNLPKLHVRSPSPNPAEEDSSDESDVEQPVYFSLLDPSGTLLRKPSLAHSQSSGYSSRSSESLFDRSDGDETSPLPPLKNVHYRSKYLLPPLSTPDRSHNSTAISSSTLLRPVTHRRELVPVKPPSHLSSPSKIPNRDLGSASPNRTRSHPRKVGLLTPHPPKRP